MSTNTQISGQSSIDFQTIQFSEDPRREPHEKETAIHIDGDDESFSITSHKRVVYESVLRRPEFEPKTIHVYDPDSARERSVDSLTAVQENENWKVMGVIGHLPVGSLTIGVPRNSNSHAEIVK